MGFIGADIVMQNSLILGSTSIFGVYHSRTKIILKSCVADVALVGEAKENASFTVIDNVFNGKLSPLLNVSTNVDGELVFKGNKLKPQTRFVVSIDEISKKPQHDVEAVIYSSLSVSTPPVIPTSKERSKHTKAMKKMVQEQGKRFVETDDNNSGLGVLYKKCQLCFQQEDGNTLERWRLGEAAVAEEKFRYCGKCRAAVYCSADCQKTHWPDHRLSCPGHKAPSSRSKNKAM